MKLRGVCAQTSCRYTCDTSRIGLLTLRKAVVPGLRRRMLGGEATSRMHDDPPLWAIHRHSLVELF